MNFAANTSSIAHRPSVREIAYAEPFSLARRLASEQALILLESVQRHEHLGRYSFLAVNPRNRLVFRLDDDMDPLATLADYLERHARPHVAGLPPFQGGLAGFISYEFGRQLEPKAKIAHHKEIAPAIVMHDYGTVISFDHMQERAWIVASNDNDAEQLESMLRKRPKVPGSHVAGPFASNMSRTQYEDAVRRTVDYILAGDIFQANITQCFSTPQPGDFDPYGLYKTLRTRNPAPFQALLDFDGIKVISSSPERLIAFDGKTAEARPIKGTRRRREDELEDAREVAALLASRKERAENVMIVDLLRNDLSRVAKPGTVRVPMLCGIESYANVHHLVSVVTGELREGLGQIDLLRAVFPGGSITGAPKIRAMEIIDELEGIPRGVYCGAIGYLGYSGHCDFNIAIRTVQVSGGTIRVQGGGGITARSDAAAEYDESLVKVQRILDSFTP